VNTLIDLGDAGYDILAAYIAKEKLRDLLALARTGPDRHRISQRLFALYDWCAHTGLPELERLAATIEQWWPAIEAFLHTRITNAASEGVNRVVKLVARNAYGFRNPTNQRLRVRCATTRRARGQLTPA
jgi:transposase